MEFFRDRLRQLGEDANKETLLFRDFFELCAEKKKALDDILAFLETKKAATLIKSIGTLRKIPELNSRLASLIRAIQRLELRDEAILKLILDLEDIKSGSLKRHVKKLKKYFQHLDDKLNYMLGLLRSQTDYFNDKLNGEISLKVISQELIKEYVHFYQMMQIERNAMHEISDIFHQIRSEIRTVFDTDNKGDKKILNRVVIEDIINPRSALFKEFYTQVLQKRYDKDELDTLNQMRNYQNRNYQRWHMSLKVLGRPEYKGQGRTHLLVARIGTSIVGGMLCEFMGLIKSRISFGVIWNFCTAPGSPANRFFEIYRILHQKTEQVLISDAQVLGYGEKFCGIFLENYSPAKMRELGVKGHEQIRAAIDISKLFKKAGYKKLDFNYIQLPPSPGLKSVRDLDLIVRPSGNLGEYWKRVGGIPKHQCLRILYLFAYCLVEEYDQDKHKDYLQMVDDITQHEIVPFVEII